MISSLSFLSSCQKMKDDSDGDKKQQIHHIQNLYAFNLFCQKRFDDSMQVFAKLGTGESPNNRQLTFITHAGCSRSALLLYLHNLRPFQRASTLGCRLDQSKTPLGPTN